MALFRIYVLICATLLGAHSADLAEKISKENKIYTLEDHCEGNICRDFQYPNPDKVAFFDLKAEVRISPDSTYDISAPVKHDTLTFVDTTFAHFPLNLFYSAALRELDMRNCSIHTVTWENFLMADNLILLWLSDNQITDIAEMTFNYAPNLHYLSLDNNQLQTLVSESFKGLKNLYYLNLSGNQLHNLPAGIFDYVPMMRELNLAENHLRVIGNELFLNNPLLSEVTLRNNELRELGDYAFKNQPQLLLLDISHNKHLDILVTNLNVRNLYANNCSLYRVNIYGVAENVNMRDNQILELYFSQPETLRTLSLHNNALQQIASLTRATKLLTLDLSGNPNLGNLPEAWLSDSLERLDLSNTSMTTIPLSSITNQENLRYLNVSYNKIREINPMQFKRLEQLTHLYIHGNDFNCYNLQLLMDLVIEPHHMSIAPDAYDPEFPGEYVKDIRCMYRIEENDQATAIDASSEATDNDSNSEEQKSNTNSGECEVQELRKELKAIVGFYEERLQNVFQMLNELKVRLDKYEMVNETFWQNVAVRV